MQKGTLMPCCVFPEGDLSGSIKSLKTMHTFELTIPLLGIYSEMTQRNTLTPTFFKIEKQK